MKNLKNVGIAKIEEIEAEVVYDITVPGNHNFFMTGQILSSNCFVVLDEAENTTKEQMKMFLTRLGYGSIISINGDHTQSDLPGRIENGLSWAARKLRGVDANINLVEFTKRDIVRHPLIEKILTHLESPDPKNQD